jgi:hypothetical protein
MRHAHAALRDLIYVLNAETDATAASTGEFEVFASKQWLEAVLKTRQIPCSESVKLTTNDAASSFAAIQRSCENHRVLTVKASRKIRTFDAVHVIVFNAA